MSESDAPPSALGARVESLERRVRLLLILAGLLGLVVVWREAVPRSRVSAQMFVLVDSAGHQYGFWRVRDGEPALVLQNGQGVWRAVLSVDPQGAGGLLLGGPAEPTRLSLSTRDDAPALTMETGTDQPGTIMLRTEQGRPSLRMEGRDERRAVVRPRSRANER